MAAVSRGGFEKNKTFVAKGEPTPREGTRQMANREMV